MTRIALVSFAALAMIAGSANAQPVTHSVLVGVGDLDLSRPDKVRVLFDRLKDASLWVCGADYRSSIDVREATRHSDCYRDALAKAVADARSPAVLAVYAAEQAPKAARRIASR